MDWAQWPLTTVTLVTLYWVRSTEHVKTLTEERLPREHGPRNHQFVKVPNLIIILIDKKPTINLAVLHINQAQHLYNLSMCIAMNLSELINIYILVYYVTGHRKKGPLDQTDFYKKEN